MHATSFFERLFARAMPVLVDDPRHAPMLARHGFTARPIDGHDFTVDPEAPRFMLFTEAEPHERFLQRWGEIPGITAHLVLAKFDTSPEMIAYAVEQFLTIDFAATLARRSARYEGVFGSDSAEVVGPHGPLLCTLGEAVEIANRDDEMEPGWLYSVAEFLEASFVNIEHDRSTFTLDGEFAFDGLVYLFNNQELRARAEPILAAWLRDAVRGGNSASFVANAMTRLRIGGVDRTAQLHAMIGERERRTAATEFAFGCVDYDVASQDWSRNSVMHEGVDGIHVGIGMGQEIPHFDLIARGARCRYLHNEAAAEAS